MLSRLDRRAIRRRALDRFSASRMADRYEAIYRSALNATPQRVLSRIFPAAT
jgi:hypothetical protein